MESEYGFFVREIVPSPFASGGYVGSVDVTIVGRDVEPVSFHGDAQLIGALIRLLIESGGKIHVQYEDDDEKKKWVLDKQWLEAQRKDELHIRFSNKALDN